MGFASRPFLGIGTGAGTVAAGDDNRIVNAAAKGNNSDITGLQSLAGGNGITPLKITFQQTYSTTVTAPAVNLHTSVFGTVTSGQATWYGFSVDIDRVNCSAIGGATAFMFGAAYGGNGLSGGRNAMFVTHTMTQDTPTGSGSGSYYVGIGAFERADYWNGGIPGNEKGSLFGINPSARAKSAGSIGSHGYRGATGGEYNVGIDWPMLAKSGVTVVEWADSKAGGKIADYGYGIAKQPSGTAPGFDFGFLFGSPFGWWPIRPAGTLIGSHSGSIGSPARAAAMGVDLSGIAFSEAAYRSAGANIDGAGNIGGQVVSGLTLDTRDGFSIRRASVGSITVLKGGVFDAKPSLAIAAPSGSGTTASASVATMTVAQVRSIVGGQGTGYTKGDVLTLVGGTFTTAAQFTVTAVNAGAILDLDVLTPGSYSVLPSAPASLSGGSGSAATVSPGWAIETITIGGAGTNYPVNPPPTVTTSGANKYYEPLFGVTMEPVSAAPSVTGSRGGNAALASLLTALANLGLISNNTVA